MKRGPTQPSPRLLKSTAPNTDQSRTGPGNPLQVSALGGRGGWDTYSAIRSIGTFTARVHGLRIPGKRSHALP